VDSRILPATCALACEQASPTLSTLSRLDRLLGYVSSHPNARKIYRASDMILRVHSDASYLSHPRAGSVAGSVHYMGMGSSTNFFAPDPEAPVNHPVSAHSTRIPVVVSFVAEAEIAGVFAAARIALDERQILADLGHPQPPTVIYCDNECAIGLANRTMTPKFSKSLDMRFHWLRDRVDQGQFRVVFVPGVQNLADFFTKSLPVGRHTTMAPFFAADDDDPDTVDSTNLTLSKLLFAAALYNTSRTKRVC
jgi:hypothetical protein